MNAESIKKDAQTVQQFVTTYCDAQHQTRPKNNVTLYEDAQTCLLCEECETTLRYSYERLVACPHDEKPSCRKCPSPCYEKGMWKKMAKIMMYSGMRLGLTKIRKLFYK